MQHNLSKLRNNETAFVSGVKASGSLRRRLEEMGFAPGNGVRRLYAAAGGSPVIFDVMGAQVALRRSEAALVAATDEKAAENAGTPGGKPAIPQTGDFEPAGGERPSSPAPAAPSASPLCNLCKSVGRGAGGSCCGGAKRPESREGETVIAIVGNPNCGKTAFFNAACGGREHTANYAGVTVQSIVGHATVNGQRVRVIDLPGTYSLHAYSPDEAYVMRELATGRVDAVINVVNAASPERHLLLTLQLRRLGLPVVVAFNMIDELHAEGSTLNLPALEQRLGLPCLPATATRGEGVAEALEAAVEAAEQAKKRKTENAETDKPGLQPANASCLPAGSEPDAATPAALLKDVFVKRSGRSARLTARLDGILTRGPLAYIIFALTMYAVFYLTFTLGQYPMDWIDNGIGLLGERLEAMLAPSDLRDLLVNGILGGVGSVIVFLPNILILYFLISLLEGSGYLARTALLADPLLSRVGLHGKSVIPLLMGFGCTVPAVMATRTIEQRKARLLTMLTLPFMSCSARLPVYVVFTGAFFPKNAALVMSALYFGGFFVAVAAAAVLNKAVRRTEQSAFVMELPPYRRPAPRSVVRFTLMKGGVYLRKMGTVILLASIAIWALGHYPRPQGDASPAEAQAQSYLGMAGRVVQPLLAPLGFDTRMSIGVLSGIGAKELMVGTLGVLYSCDENDAAVETADEAAGTRLAAALRASVTPAAALSYLVFALLYFPCFATIAAIGSESGRRKIALFAALYTTLTAYVAAFIVYRIALLF